MIRDYNCIIVNKASGEQERAKIRLDTGLGLLGNHIVDEHIDGILCSVSSWDDLRELAKPDHEATFTLKTVTL